jgi:L-ascorbate metabolism protein UlaG (beta-lactamase superfamily)
MKSRTLVCWIALPLLLGVSILLAGANKSDADALLNGVVHLTDDDVRFRTADGVVVFVDPVSWPTDELVVNSGMVKPDLILITHSHADHFQPTIILEYLNLNPKAIVVGPRDVVAIAKGKLIPAQEVHPGEKHTIAGITFATVPMYFEQGDSHPKAKQWVGYLLHLNGSNYYVTGDTQPFPEMAGLTVDVLFPLLSGCGGNMDQALQMSELTKARVVVPVHTGGRLETIKKYIQRLPDRVAAGYYQDGKLVAGS